MAAVNRFYSSNAIRTTIVSTITSTATTVTVGATTGFPGSVPFTLVLDEGQVLEEIVTVTGVAGTTLTVVRGVDGTTGVTHSTGANVVHAMTARDLREPQEHIAATTGVHGVTGAVIGAGELSAHTGALSGSHGLVYSIGGAWGTTGVSFGGDGSGGALGGDNKYRVTNGWCFATCSWGWSSGATYARPMSFNPPVTPLITNNGPSGTGGNGFSILDRGTVVGDYHYRSPSNGNSSGVLIGGFDTTWTFYAIKSDGTYLSIIPAANDIFKVNTTYPA